MKNSNSFTLIELLVVAVVISLLSATGMVSYSSLSKNSRDARRKADLSEIRTALEIYKSDHGFYPASLLTSDCSSSSFIEGRNTYMQKTPVDPLCKSTNLRFYSYKSSPIGCNNSTILCSNYTLGALLESGGVNICLLLCSGGGSESNCNYCLNTYGEL